MQIHDRLKMLRKERGESQEKVARGIDITLRNYQRIENGKGCPSYPILCALGDYFQVNLDYLAGRTDVRDMLPPSSEQEGSHG